MKNTLFITSVLALLIFCATPGRSQSAVNHMSSASAATMAKCVGGSDCKACKNCSACAHCKENGGKCSVCKKSSVSQKQTESKPATTNEEYTEVAWSAISLKPAATTLQSLGVRSGPGATFKLVGNISSKDSLIIIGEREGWYKIVVPHADLVGFVEAGYIEIVGSETATAHR